MSHHAISLFSDFVIMDGDKSASVEAFTETFFQDMSARYGGFRGCELISAFGFESDWPVWERHPNGDEIVVLIKGSVELVLETEDGEQLIPLTKPGQAVVVPKGIWHTTRIKEVAQMLFITPGEGTEHKDVIKKNI